jgi:hypothetical protein
MAPKQGQRLKKNDNGFLPVLHPPIVFKANKGHRVRNYANFFFGLALKAKAGNSGRTVINAKRMKRQMS